MRKIALTSLLVLISFPLFCQEALVTCKLGECTLCDVFETIANIINFVLFTIVPAVAILMMAIGGVYYISSFGQPDKIQKAHSVLRAAFIGAIIAYGGWMIISLVLFTLGVNSSFGEWATIPGC